MPDSRTGRLDLQREGVGAGNLHLGLAAQRTQHPDIFEGPQGGADNGQHFLAGILSRLGEILKRGELIALAEQRVRVGPGQVDMAVGYADRHNFRLLAGIPLFFLQDLAHKIRNDSGVHVHRQSLRFLLRNRFI